jgi:hypothetical protein
MHGLQVCHSSFGKLPLVKVKAFLNGEIARLIAVGQTMINDEKGGP